MKKKVLWVGCILLLFIIGLNVWFLWTKQHKEEPPKEMTEEEVIDFMRRATVQIHVGERSGSGVILEINDERVTLVTCFHLMQGYDQGIISFCSGQVGFANVVHMTSAPDLCFLTFDRSDLDESVLSEIRAANPSEEDYETLQLESQVYLCGSAISSGSNLTLCKVVDKSFYEPEFDSKVLYLYGDAMPGMSGCGAYTKDGKLVGILAGGSDTSECVCVSLTDVINEWRTFQ